MTPPWLAAAVAQVNAMRPRLPHALLVRGPGGWGEDHVVNALAIELMGLDADANAREVAHPDMRWLAPQDGTIKIDAVRDIIGFLMQTPHTAGRKVAVIQDAEQMNANAANALLKTLEEPPAESFLALCSGAPGRLLPTIRSRCQRVEIRPGPAATVLAWLRDAGVDGNDAGYWAVEFGGAPFAILEASGNGWQPLWPALAKAGGAPTALDARLTRGADGEDLASLAGRWLHIVHWLLRRSPTPARGAILDFAAELLEVRRLALLNTALNRSLQMQRLLLLWAKLWPHLPTDAEPRLLA